MSPEHDTTRPIGVVVTLEEIYGTVQSIDNKMDKDLRLLREEMAKLTAIIFLVQRGITL